ncbi:MAG TPA: TIGR02444 family protein [Acetobacteraceae bacterium]|nr:TIGR02444 family protein [Acetobacteraceae bacterium]
MRTSIKAGAGMGGLWEFSLAIYAMPGVAPACLRCQDESGADVNMLLFLLWQTRRGKRLTNDEIKIADRLISGWRSEIVHPLRKARRALKTMGEEALRARIAAAELEAERLQQERLAAWAEENPAQGVGMPPGAAARASLEAYSGMIEKPLPAEAVEALLAAFVEANRKQPHG